jgi:hypothetical protein
MTLLWLKENWGWIWKVGAVLLVALLAWGLLHSYGAKQYKAGYAGGQAYTQAQWDEERKSQQEAYDAQVARTEAAIEAQRQAEKEVADARVQITAADAAGRSLSQRLRDYERSLRRCRTLPAPGTDSSLPAGPVGEPASDEEVERLSDDAWAACARDAVRLEKIEQWRLSLPPEKVNGREP